MSATTTDFLGNKAEFLSNSILRSPVIIEATPSKIMVNKPGVQFFDADVPASIRPEVIIPWPELGGRLQLTPKSFTAFRQVDGELEIYNTTPPGWRNGQFIVGLGHVSKLSTFVFRVQ